MSPSDAAWRLLKGPEDFDEIQDDLERSKTEGRRSFPEGRRKKRSMGSGSTEEERKPRERPNARNRAPSLEATEAFYDSLELHPGSRGHEINALRNEAGPRSHAPQFGTFMPLDTKEYIFEEEAENILPQEPPLGPDDRMRNVALRRETLSEVPTFAQIPFNPLTGFTRSEPMDLAWRLLKYEYEDPHTHLCKHCGDPIYHHLQQGQGDGSHPPQEVWSNEDDEGGNCLSPSGFCEPGESLGKTYSDGSPIEATPESHPNQIFLNGRFVNVNDWNDEHEREQQANKNAEGMPIVNWNSTWDWDEGEANKSEPMDLTWRLLKDYYFKEPEFYDEDGNPMQTTRSGKKVPLAAGIASPTMKPKYNLAHPRIVALGHKGADAFAQFLGPAVAHEETHRAMEPDIRAAMNELPDTMSDEEKRAYYMRAHEIGAHQGQFPGGQEAHEEAEATALGQRDSPRHPFIDESITNFPKPILRSEPMDLAWQLLKTRMDVERERNRPALRPTRKKPPGTHDREKRERIDRLIEEERGMSLEEYRNKVIDDAYNRNYFFRSGGQSRLPGYIEHFATSNRQLGKPEIPQSARLPSIADALRNVEQNRIADAAPARPKPKTLPARLHMSVPNKGRRNFFLQDEEGNPLATIEDSGRYTFDTEDRHGRNIRGFSGSSQEKRRGHYRDLIESLLRHGFTLRSESRNEMSNPFHRKFLRTLPDDIRAKIDAEQGKLDVGPLDPIRYEAHAPFSRTKDLDYGDLVVETRSKYPMTYETPYQSYKRKLEEGIDPMQNILVPSHYVKVGDEFEAVPRKQYFQSRLAGTGFDPSDQFDGITTREGIVVPRGLKLNTYYTPFVQTGGVMNMTTMPSAQTMMDFGIDPATKLRQRVGVVDSGAPRFDEQGGQS